MADSTHPTLPETADVLVRKEQAAEADAFRARVDAGNILSGLEPPPDPAAGQLVVDVEQAKTDLGPAIRDLATLQKQTRDAQELVDNLRAVIRASNDALIAQLADDRRAAAGLPPAPSR